MKRFHTICTAVCLVTLAAIVGCGNPKTTDKTKTQKTDKTVKTDEEKTTPDEKTPDAKTAAKTKEPMPTVPMPKPKEKTDVKPTLGNPSSNAESGSTEKKDGPTIPNNDPTPGNAESGSTEKKGATIPKE